MLQLMFVIVLFLLFPGQMGWTAEKISITADSAVLMDAHTGQVLFAKNAYEPRPPASTTKIATALVALEMGKLDEIVTVSEKAASVGESSMYLVPGEKLTLEQLLTGALVRSGNDACVAIAEHVVGSEELFARLVTGRARFLGATDTSFVNSNGLPARGHFSSAYDLALLTRYALLDPTFREIIGTRFTIIQGQGHWVHNLTNTNKLLWEYPGATGVKTGTTNEAGQCLVASAIRNGRCLISVVLHSDNRYKDTIKLLEYGFNNFTPTTVIQEGEILKKIPVKNGALNYLPLVADRSLIFLSPVNGQSKIEKRIILWDSEPEAPLKSGSSLGQVWVFYQGKAIGCAKLVTKTSVARDSFIFSLLHRFTGR